LEASLHDQAVSDGIGLRAVRFVEAGESRHAVAERLGVFNGPINGESFLRYVEQFLVPTLKSGDERISSLLEMFTSQECANYFANSGYGDV
jgi:hypothetical protein